MAKQETKTKSKFYVAEKVIEAKAKIETKVKTVNDKLIKKQFESSREFLSELKADPVKRIDVLIVDSKDAIKKVKTEKLETLQKKVNTTKSKIREKLEKINLETKRFIQELEMTQS